MARVGDEDEVGRGASVAQLSDAARRRSERASSPDHDDGPAVPDPSAGIELITNVRADEPDDHVEALADDVLDQALARQQGAPDATLRGLRAREEPGGEPRTDPPDPGQDEQQRVREILEHHHERLSPRELSTMAPRGSADLAAPLRKTSAPRVRRSPVKAARRARPRRRVAGILAAVATVVVVVAVVGAEAGSSTPKHHGTPAAVTAASTQGVTGPTSLAALDITRVTAAITNEGKTVASAHTAMEAKAKARAKARARARADVAARARVARARRRRQAAARTHASSTSGSTAAGSRGATTTDPVYTTPANSTRPSSAGSSSDRGGGSGSSSAPAGPTGVGSAGGNCNPKCS